MRSPHACYGPSNHGVQSTGDASFGGTRRASAGSFRSISAVRRHRRARRPVLHDRPRPDLRADRAERRGQDDAVQRRQPHLRPDERDGAVRRRGPAERPRARHRRVGHRPHVPEPGAVPGDDRARERHGRRRTRRRSTGSPAAFRIGAAQRGAALRREALRDPGATLGSADLACRPAAACRSARSSASRSPGRSRPAPRLLLLDEPAGRPDPRRGRRARRELDPLPARRATSSRCCSSSTTWRW